MSENTTPAEFMDIYDVTANSGNTADHGRADAVYHIGALMSQSASIGTVQNAQEALADTSDPDYDAKYHYGYLTAWNAICGLVKGDSLKTIAKNYG